MRFSRKKSYIRISNHTEDKNVPIDLNNAPTVPEGMWQKCPNCKETILTTDMGDAKICPHCQYHFRVQASERLAMICDAQTFTPMFQNAQRDNPLAFPGYEDKKAANQAKTGLDEAILTGTGQIFGFPVALGFMDPFFLMGSMGATVGEKVTQLFNYATEHGLPVILFTASGGARMQEGILSLMQMAKTSMAVERHHEAGLLYIPVLTDPTTGGVTASFAMEGDIILAEPGAMIGFAGKRVIEQTIRQQLPENFQTAEHQLKHGFVDHIVERWRLKVVLGELLLLNGVQKG